MSRRLKFAFVLLILIKLMLVAGLPIAALADAGYDDALFMRLASNIVNGQWLGPYDALTLAKGPAYSVFLALTFFSHLPLPMAEQLLYVFFCIVLVVALKPAIPAPAARLFLFAVVLFNPISFGTNQMARVIREGIYPAVTGLVVACAFATALRREKSLASLYRWATALGFILGIFWLTREEGIWIVPTLALVLGSAMICLIRKAPVDLVKRLTAFVLPAALATGIVCSEAALNRRVYGEFITVEFRDPAFIAAYGALARVTPQTFRPRVPVARETRERIYAVSPAFNELRPYLEGDMGRGWENTSARIYPQFPDEITAGWFMWALREAVALAGHGGSAKNAHHFYVKLAAEVNAAADDRRLNAGPRRDTLMPAWRWSYLPEVLSHAWYGTTQITAFVPLRNRIPQSTGGAEEKSKFHQMSHAPFSDGPLTGRLEAQLYLIGDVIWLYRWIGPAWSILSALLYVFLAVMFLKGLRSWLFLFATSLLLAIVTRLAILSLIAATSFPAMALIYLSCLHPLSLTFNALVMLEALHLARQKLSAASAANNAPPLDIPGALTGR